MHPLLAHLVLAAGRADSERRLAEALQLLSPTALIAAMVLLGFLSIYLRYRERSPGLVWGVRGLAFTCGMLAVVVTLMSGFVSARKMEREKKARPNTSGLCAAATDCAPGYACIPVGSEQRCRQACSASKPCGPRQRCISVQGSETACVEGPR